MSILSIVQPESQRGVVEVDGSSPAAMLNRPISDLSDLQWAAEYALERILPAEKERMLDDLTAQGIDEDEVPANHRRKVVEAKWTRGDLNGALTVGQFAMRIDEAIVQLRHRLQHSQNNGHWFVEKVELVNPARTAWTERVMTSSNSSRSNDDGRTVETHLVASGSGMTDAAANRLGIRLNDNGSTNTVRHPTFVLRITFADTTPNADRKYIEEMEQNGERQVAPDNTAQIVAVATAVAKVMRETGNGSADAPVADAADKFPGIPTHGDDGKPLHHKTREAMFRRAQENA